MAGDEVVHSTFRSRRSLSSELHPTRRVAPVRETLLLLGWETRPDKCSPTKMGHEKVDSTKDKPFNVMSASISAYIVKVIKTATHSKFPRQRGSTREKRATT